MKNHISNECTGLEFRFGIVALVRHGGLKRPLSALNDRPADAKPAPMLEKVMPSVVSINVEGSTTVNTPRMPRVICSSSLATPPRSAVTALRSRIPPFPCQWRR